MKGYNVYKNGNFITFVAGRNAKIRKWTARQLVWPNTHMGGWTRRSNGEFEYATTIGVYIRFEPAVDT